MGTILYIKQDWMREWLLSQCKYKMNVCRQCCGLMCFNVETWKTSHSHLLTPSSEMVETLMSKCVKTYWL